MTAATRAGDPESRGSLATGLVFAFLVLVAAVPLLLQVKFREHRDYIMSVAEPARGAVTEVQMQLGLEAVAARGYVLTSDTSYAAIYRNARRDRDQSLDTLRSVVNRLPARTAEQVFQLDTLFREADRFIAGFMTGALPRESYLESMAERQAAFTSAVSSLAALDRVIGEEVADRIERLRRIEQLQIGLTSLLVLLGLGSAAAANRLLTERSRQAAERERILAAERVAREEAEAGRRELQRLSDSRAGLMRGFGHDVKNPLGAADGYLELLAEGILGPLDQRQSDSVLRARRALAHGLNLIEDLIELARAETIEIQRRDVDLGQLVAELVQDYRGRATAKGLDLALAPTAGVLAVKTDPARVRQILGNLLSNAVKYTERGSIRVSASIEADESGGTGSATISVADTGPGIRQEQQSSLFREFHRLDSAAGTEGAGIGLAISRRLARALGGDLTMQSEVGKGSTFTLSLPA